MSTPTIRGELFRLWPEWQASEPQRHEAARRRRLYRGDYKSDVHALVRRIGPADAESREEIVKFVDTAHGLLGAVADTCAVVYQRGVRRELRGASDAAASAFAALVAESGIAAVGPSLNALAWATGPVIAVPHVVDVRGELRLSVTFVTADSYTVRRHTTVPDVLLAVLYQRGDGVFVEVDEQGWRYWTANGSPLDGGRHDAAHAIGYCPAVVIRARPWLAFDWWGTSDHVGLTDAALKISYLHALGQWTRTQTSAPLTVVTAMDNKYAKLQSIAHPSRPLVFDATPGEVGVQVHDRTTDPNLYLAEIQAIINAAVARYGIPPSAATFAPSEGGVLLALNATPGALALQRDAQTPLLREGEIALWRLACDVVRASAHPLAKDLPPADEVRKVLRIAFPDLADVTEQGNAMRVFAQRLPHGLGSATDELMRDRPELTRLEAREEIDANKEEYAEGLDFLASRNAPKDAQRGVELASGDPSAPGSGVQSLAQKQGREGGRASAESRSDEPDDNSVASEDEPES